MQTTLINKEPKIPLIYPGEIKTLLLGLIATVLGTSSFALEITQWISLIAALGGVVVMSIGIINGLLRRQNFTLENRLLKDQLKRLEERHEKERPNETD